MAKSKAKKSRRSFYRRTKTVRHKPDVFHVLPTALAVGAVAYPAFVGPAYSPASNFKAALTGQGTPDQLGQAAQNYASNLKAEWKSVAAALIAAALIKKYGKRAGLNVGTKKVKLA